MHRELLRRGRKVSPNTVAKAMRSAGIRAKTARRLRVRTTDSNHPHRIAPNLVDRDFTADGVNEVWVCDITYVPTREGFLYVAGILDLHSRMIVGWSMADHMRVELVGDALEMAHDRASPAATRRVSFCCTATGARSTPATSTARWSSRTAWSSA
ncbi:MAG: DDE-type integrase/transposase/recombinase [Phycisphaerales bacterium]|jgi:transposase InsO family protein